MSGRALRLVLCLASVEWIVFPSWIAVGNSDLLGTANNRTWILGIQGGLGGTVFGWQSRPGQIVRGHSKEGVTTPGPVGTAEIIVENAPVYQHNSAQGAPVTMLKKGDVVWIDLEIKSEKESWCRLKRAADANVIGFVRCTDLHRRARGK